MKPIIQFDQVSKTYQRGEVSVPALRDAAFEIQAGEFVIIFGASGAGKSTLLNILGGIDQASAGRVMVDGQDITQYSEQQLTKYRREKVGFIFQFYNLIAHLTALENVAFASEGIRDVFLPQAILAQVGLADKQDYFPAQLSGGEQQRVAIARAVAKKPQFLLCDEPTGALDSQAGAGVLRLLEQLNREYGATLILITHNPELLSLADKVLHMQNGEIKQIVINQTRRNREEIRRS